MLMGGATEVPEEVREGRTGSDGKGAQASSGQGHLGKEDRSRGQVWPWQGTEPPKVPSFSSVEPGESSLAEAGGVPGREFQGGGCAWDLPALPHTGSSL